MSVNGLVGNNSCLSAPPNEPPSCHRADLRPPPHPDLTPTPLYPMPEPGTAHVQIEYRRDIDGLRAVAVALVVLFHFAVPGFGGGYIGVDVFFVISGFLITRLIATEHEKGSFSLAHFYERRARRILPALLVVIAAVLAASLILYLPGDLPGAGASAAAALAFVANFYFFYTTDYFHAATEVKPLLHTWSLGVEEQFYLLFPVALTILLGRTRRTTTVVLIAAAALASFGLSVWKAQPGVGSAFYLLPHRSWELLAGALLALGVVPVMVRRGMREGVAVLGILAIVGASAVYDRSMVFPGTAALVPVAATAALIHAGRDTWVGRALSVRPLVGLGLISYALYLWHWPMIAFGHYVLGETIGVGISLGLAAAALALSVLSWRFVETPMRDLRRVGRGRLIAMTGGGVLVLLALSTAIAAGNGWPGRFDPAAVRAASARLSFSPTRKLCIDRENPPPDAVCRIGSGPVDALVWSDSHGGELAYALARLPSRRGRALVEHARSGCPPVLGIAIPTRAGCQAANAHVVAALATRPGIRTVYVAGHWTAYQRVEPPAFWDGLDRAIAALVASGRHVVLVGPVPPPGFDVPRRLALAAQFGLGTPTGPSRAGAAAGAPGFARVAARWRNAGVTVVLPEDVFCDAIRCQVTNARGNALYFDSNHPSLTGAALIAAQIVQAERAARGLARP